MTNKYRKYNEIYTDVSCKIDVTAYKYTDCRNVVRYGILSSQTSIITAEMTAISKAIKYAIKKQ